jgi:hypothetical protein
MSSSIPRLTLLLLMIVLCLQTGINVLEGAQSVIYAKRGNSTGAAPKIVNFAYLDEDTTPDRFIPKVEGTSATPAKYIRYLWQCAHNSNPKAKAFFYRCVLCIHNWRLL